MLTFQTFLFIFYSNKYYMSEFIVQTFYNVNTVMFTYLAAASVENQIISIILDCIR